MKDWEKELYYQLKDHNKDENDKIPHVWYLKLLINIIHGGLLMCIAFKIASMIQNLETIFDDIFIKTIFTSDISYHKI